MPTISNLGRKLMEKISVSGFDPNYEVDVSWDNPSHAPSRCSKLGLAICNAIEEF